MVIIAEEAGPWVSIRIKARKQELYIYKQYAGFHRRKVSHSIIGGVFIMAYKISDDCISCGACASECPTECISEGDGKYVIDADACIECGSCAAVCPVDAPKQD